MGPVIVLTVMRLVAALVWAGAVAEAVVAVVEDILAMYPPGTRQSLRSKSQGFSRRRPRA